MLLLGKLKVGPVVVPVLVDKDLDGYGCFDSLRSPRIRINQLTGLEREMTLLHELLHVFSEHYGLRLSESSVRVLEQIVTQFVLDNPECAKDWVNRVLESEQDKPIRLPVVSVPKAPVDSV